MRATWRLTPQASMLGVSDADAGLGGLRAAELIKAADPSTLMALVSAMRPESERRGHACGCGAPTRTYVRGTPRGTM
jgi:hypothetical protein